jgi:hypothetical protein
MPSGFPIGSIIAALESRLFPSITVWNRLEGRPRTRSFDRALRAEVRDPLWMLTKQWQMGEFRGSDAGSPVFAKLMMSTTRLTKYRPGTHAAQPFENDVPLEAKVERRPLTFVTSGHPVALDLRLLMGRQWLSLIAGIGDYRAAYLAAYPIAVPDSSDADEADRAAHPDVQALYRAVAGRAMDGAALYAHLHAGPGNHAYDGIAIAPADEATHQAALDERATRFLAWFARLIIQPPPGGDDAWMPERLEYQFALSAPVAGGEKVYVADEYYDGRLDWYDVDVDKASAGLDAVAGSDVTGLPADAPQTTIPVPVSFAGMPNTRWWSFEDHKTNFGDIDASTTDLAKLLFMEFALVYANDWFVIPYTLPAGAIATLRGLTVTNVFGERFWIEAAGGGADADWQRWSMFTVNVHNDARAAADTSLLVLPTVPKIQESSPVEDVLLIRDEVANMVWGVEKTIVLASGESTPGAEAAREKRALLEALLASAPTPPPPAPNAAIRYRIMNTVPEEWIPFVPVHVKGSNRKIQLQRAALPRILEGDPSAAPPKVRPRTALLRPGLDTPALASYFVHEEEVPRAGARVLQSYARTRWIGGRVYTWLRVRKETGRGEGSAGLAFDEIVDVPK